MPRYRGTMGWIYAAGVWLGWRKRKGARSRELFPIPKNAEGLREGIG
jgi:hypothetical protein